MASPPTDTPMSDLPDARPLVVFSCPHCKFDLRAAGSLAGRATTCPICERPLTVPLESDPGLPSPRPPS